MWIVAIEPIRIRAASIKRFDWPMMDESLAGSNFRAFVKSGILSVCVGTWGK